MSKSGFTFIEALIATAIAAIGFSTVLAINVQCFRLAKDMRATARSSQILQQKMEDIRSLSWSQVQALPSTFTDPNDTAGLYAGRIMQSVYDSYSGTSTVASVTLLVSWTNSAGVTSNTLSTLVANGGLNQFLF